MAWGSVAPPRFYPAGMFPSLDFAMTRNLSFSTKGIVLVSIPFLFQLLFIAVLTAMQRNNVKIHELASHSKEVRIQADLVMQNLIDAETGIRGFNLTDDPTFTEPYDRAVQQIPEDVRRLRELVKDDRDQTERAEQIEDRAIQVLAWLAETNRLVKNGKREQASARESSKGGKQLMDALRREIADFHQAEEGLEKQRLLAWKRSRWWSAGVLLGGTAAALLTTIGLGFAFRRNISQRFAVLMDNTKRLAAGKTLVPPIAGADEIAQVDAVFHELAAALAAAAGRERRYTETLERRVAERTAELTAANRDLAHKNQENELFVYSVSHDLRSPLVNLQGFSNELSLAAEDLRALFLEPELPEAVRQRGLAVVDGDIAESVRFIRSGVMRLSHIIDALLRLSRAGRVEYSWREVDVSAVVERVTESLKGTMEKHAATVTVHNLPPAWGDSAALEQVFANLIGNALNYLDPVRTGRIEVGCVSAPSEESANGFAVYYVRDNGLGIAAAYLPKVFQAFQRLHPEAVEGEGMGLTIVRRVVERHQGNVRVESTAGEGSTFFLSLPTRPVAANSEALLETASTC
jgi:signal transduction histidine kinase